jgi:putative membrane-bound dehydrogenase-like protein
MTALLLSLALLAPAADPAPKPTPSEGVLPRAADGRPLNLDFETGTLQDWTAEGEAFKDQPIKGDTVHPRRGDMRSRHQGQFWVGGYEKYQDKPQGTLTSAPFTVTHPWASFLIGGGPWTEQTCVELVDVKRNIVFYRATGLEEEDLRREVVDLTRHVGKLIQIRLVDKHSGHWGHINFDDFRFHGEKPNVPARPVKQVLKADEYRFSGLKPQEAAAAMTVPEGFEVRLFAGEPDVHQPVGFCLDDRGRLWVAEAYTYPKRHPHPGPVIPDSKLGDRIVIFEDVDGDGKHDKRTVFMEGLNLVSGIEVGFGGVWIGAAPYLLFIPDKNGDDKPDGPPQILLDGWGYQDTHETLNSFIWGPDGWLYGCHGVFTHSRVGKPGTPDAERIPINAGVWRYHPVKHTFEVFAHGTSNPWGLDYNDVGDFFVEACVIPHLFHIVQGGRYHRQAGQHFNPYTYADIQTIADHRHYAGPTPHGGNNKSDSMGGGHAHCGLMCYLGGTWPKEYRGQLFMGNIHGRRLNVDIPKPKGSGYTASHGKDFLLANDAWARFINLRYGPDGNVYLIDWYDKQACHRPEPEIWDRTNGRIYKIVYKGAKPMTGLDLQKCTDDELVKYQLHDNDWYVRHARRILMERAPNLVPPPHGDLSPEAKKLKEQVLQLVTGQKDPRKRLRGLWLAGILGATYHEDYARLIASDPDEHVRAWAVRLGWEDRMTRVYTASIQAARDDPSPVVRRTLASVLIQKPKEQRGTPNTADILGPLVTHTADADDPNLPYLNWYALEPLGIGNSQEALYQSLLLAQKGAIPGLLEKLARRVAANDHPNAILAAVQLLSEVDTDRDRLALLNGLAEGLKGRRGLDMPREWEKAYRQCAASANADVRARALTVAVSLGDPVALNLLRGVLADRKIDPGRRADALTSLLLARDPNLQPVLEKLLDDPPIRGPVIRALAQFEDFNIANKLLALYAQLPPAEKRDAIATLGSRKIFAFALMEGIGVKQVPAADVTAEVIRQLRAFNDPGLNKRIGEIWGTVRDTPADRKKLISEWSKRLTAKKQEKVDLAHGRAVFAKVCQQCHTLYGVGGKVGPDITGSNRSDLAYLLENMFDPSAVIPKEYAATKLDLTDGRTLIGIVKEETKQALTLLTQTETLTIPLADIDRRTPSELSMMPDDLTKQATDADIRALIAYLRHNQQVPILATQETAKEFFNGKDLTGWDGDREVWSVENSEIVGKTKTGLKRNNFLKSTMEVTDFKLTVKVKLVPNTENSGIQFRSVPIEGGEMRGPQADIGKGWWGKLYEESGRGLLWKESGEKHVKADDWNEYVVEAKGSKVRTWINGQLCVDLDDPKLARRGVIAFQIHSGGPMEVRFKDIKLEVLK